MSTFSEAVIEDWGMLKFLLRIRTKFSHRKNMPSYIVLAYMHCMFYFSLLVIYGQYPLVTLIMRKLLTSAFIDQLISFVRRNGKRRVKLVKYI